jgi:hypothetical protein
MKKGHCGKKKDDSYYPQGPNLPNANVSALYEIAKLPQSTDPKTGNILVKGGGVSFDL